MRVLLDHNIPIGLAQLLSQHEVTAAATQGWENLANGKLLRAAEDAGFEAMITADQGIVYQQNMQGREISLVVLSTNHWPTLRVKAEEIAAAISSANRQHFIYLQLSPTRSS